MTDVPANEDELLSVAFSLQSNPGAYALLLGAGVSASSGIPTAWGVLADLVGRVADLAGEQPADAITWYQARFGAYPTYEGVLERIAPTQIERQRLLRGYFEQSAEDVETGQKLPTAAHRAIARLASSGAVRVIVTLNFDHLIEQALRAEGIEPTVVASPADIEGMAPLHTLDCCVVHLHGDYLNPTTMLNTVTELESYDSRTAGLLQRILEDYGLIVAGWSSKYDPALRSAIAAHHPNRFTMTWFEPAVPSEEATILRTLKKGVHVPLDADTGFGWLADGVAALNSRRSRHPLTIPVAVDTAKRELSGRPVAIGLHDRLRQELGGLHQFPEFHLADYQLDADYESMLVRVEEASRVSAALLAALAYWGDEKTDRWWLNELPRFATPVDGSGLVKLLSLRVVAGSIFFYAAGVAAVAAERFDLVGRLFALKRPNRFNGGFDSFASSMDSEAGYEGAANPHTRLFDVVAPLLRESLALGTEPLEEAWQFFEVLRLTWTTCHSPRFAELAADYATQGTALDAAERAVAEAQRHASMDASAAQATRAAAWENRDRVLGKICRLAPVVRPHVLTADNRGEERYQSVTALRLLDDLAAENSAHPVIASGLLRDADSTRLAMRAVSTRLGMIGRDLAWSRVREAVGTVPSQVWLDSGQTPHERADGPQTS